VGTELYMPPEALDNYEDEVISQSRDIWGCGVAMFYIAYMKHPFLENSKMKTTLNIYEGKFLSENTYFYKIFYKN
jgi:serine/threonine protein kinase